MKKQIKTIGEIIAWEEENGKHYPVFKFITKDNKEIIARNNSFIDKEIEEASLESQYSEEFVTKILETPLPYQGVYILYNEDNPYIFLPRWIEMDPEVFYNPEKNIKEESMFKFFGGYIVLIIANIIFPIFGMIPSFIYAKGYLDEYRFEHNFKSLFKSILYWCLFGFGILYFISIGVKMWSNVL